jgi:hypothetical protein
MVAPFLLAIALISGDVPTIAPPCLPMASAQRNPAPSAFKDHRELREAIGDQMPHAKTMVMLYGAGGHLVTEQYSIILVRAANGIWRGSAVGRSQIWVKDAPFIPMDRVDWVLDNASSRELDDAISRRCPSDGKASSKPSDAGVPPLGSMTERIDVIMPGHSLSTFYADEGGEQMAKLIRPRK